MQDKYAGDVGDYVKLALLRSLSEDRKLGVTWYLYPDERDKKDGKHTGYLKEPSKWRHLDPDLFDALKFVRRQGFWHQCRSKLRESSAHLVGFIMQRVVCDASAAFRVSSV